MDGFQTFIVVAVLLYPILITGNPKPPENIQISVTRYKTIISWKIVQSNIDWVRLVIKDAENNKHRFKNGYYYVDIKPPNTSYEVSRLAPCNSYTAELYSMVTAGYSDTVKTTFWLAGKPEQPTNFSYKNVTFRQATLLWTAGFDGGGKQTFTIFYKNENDDNFKGPVEVGATDTRKGTKIHHILRGLLSLTSYDVVLVATNEYGTINISLQFTTEAEPVLTSPLLTQRPISIGAAAGVAVLVLALFICFIAKMKKGGNDTRSTNVRTDKNTKKKSREELADSDIIPGQSNAEYACVNKPAQKGLQKKEDKGNSNSEYACVNKSTSSGPQKEVFDDENINANRLDDSSPIMNAESKSPGRRVNDDGLVYIEVVFPNHKSDSRPIIIPGDEDRTNYVDIDFTKKAELLSDSGND